MAPRTASLSSSRATSVSSMASTSSSSLSPEPFQAAISPLSPPRMSFDSPRDVKHELIIEPSLRRRQTPRQPTLQPSSTKPLQAPKTEFAISAPANNYYFTSRQDEPDHFVNPSSSTTISTNINNSEPYPNNVFQPTTTAGSNHRLSSPRHVSLNNSNNRPRTSSKVFTSTSDLASHYGIPQFLPAPPRTTPRRQSSALNATTTATATTAAAAPQPPSSNSPTFDFALCSDYLNMLSRTDDTTTISGTPAVLGASTTSNEELAAFVEGLQGEFKWRYEHLYSMTKHDSSPDYRDKPLLDFSDFLTSPLESSPWEDSPFNDFLNTPVIPSSGGLMDVMNTPAVADYGDSFGGDFGQLFPSMGDFNMEDDESSKAQPQRTTLGPEELIKMSPSTPALPDPNTVFPSPISPPLNSMPAPTHTTTTARRKTIPTGTRKNLTPDALVPLDAPTQKRSYISPSATSRKEVPAVFLRKRARSQAFGPADDEDELEEIILGPNATEAEQIEAKRRQNTIAARRSRKRKLAYTRELEDKVDMVTEERDVWKSRALACEALLKHHGLEAPEF